MVQSSSSTAAQCQLRSIKAALVDVAAAVFSPVRSRSGAGTRLVPRQGAQRRMGEAALLPIILQSVIAEKSNEPYEKYFF